MKPGIYALAALTGAPLRDDDMQAFGLGPPDHSRFAGRIVDPSVDGVHSGHDVTDGATVIFAGFLDDPEPLARALGLAPDAPGARLVGEALRRWGESALERMAGEWSLVFDDGRGSALLACSQRLRDPLHYAFDGARLAVAPSLAALAALQGVEDAFDPEPLLLHMSGWGYRSTLGARTWLKGVRQVPHGRWVKVSPGRIDEGAIGAVGWETTPWRGGFEEAVAELDRRCRRIVREQLRRNGDVAVLLSGGLDSSLIAHLAVAEARAGQRVIAVSSVAPPGSGLADERAFIHAAADHLGIEVVEVSPTAEQSPYQPSPADQARWESPGHGLRHDLYLALNAAAADAGVTLTLDGGFGEFSVTRRCQLATPATRLRHAASQLRRRWRSGGEAWPLAGLHVQPSAEALALMVERFGRRGPADQSEAPRAPDRPLGPPLAPEKLGRATTASAASALRATSPFRAQELAIFVAALPARFTDHGGYPRALARHMMAGAVPDMITWRTTKGPFSPGHQLALVRHAAAARARLPLHRANGAGDWLDLDWLDQALREMEHGGRSDLGWSTRVQCTAMAAEFFSWWRTRSDVRR